MLDALKGFIGSKKGIAFLAGAGLLLVNAIFKLELDPELIEKLTGLNIGYMLSQGVADLGKGKLQAEAAAAAATKKKK